MAMDDADFASLIEQARRGDEAAARQILEAYGTEVQMMIRVRLPRRLRSQFDSMDFAQEVWTSFFTGLKEDSGGLDSPRHLEAFLAGIVRNKVNQEHRRRTRTRKYDLGREERLYHQKGDREVPVEVPSTAPTASQLIQAQDRLDQFGEGNPTTAEVVRLRQQGLTFEEIAGRTGQNERTIRRIVEALRRRMEAQGWN